VTASNMSIALQGTVRRINLYLDFSYSSKFHNDGQIQKPNDPKCEIKSSQFFRGNYVML